MKKTIITAGLGAFVWIILIQAAITGFSVHSESCCSSSYEACDPGMACDSNTGQSGSSMFSILKSALVVGLLFMGVNVAHSVVKGKTDAHKMMPKTKNMFKKKK